MPRRTPDARAVDPPRPGGDSRPAIVLCRPQSCSNENIPWTAAILAGGQARRLGGIDKSALVVGTRSILERQLSLLHGITSHILIVGSGGSEVQSDGIRIRVVADRIPGAGALGGLYTALVEAPTEQVLVIA